MGSSLSSGSDSASSAESTVHGEGEEGVRPTDLAHDAGDLGIEILADVHRLLYSCLDLGGSRPLVVGRGEHIRELKGKRAGRGGQGEKTGDSEGEVAHDERSR